MNTNEIIELGKKIREKRRHQNITQQELSMRLGVGLSTIRNLEYGCIKSVGEKLNKKLELYLSENDEHKSDIVDNWGEWVQSSRIKNNISQQQLADAVGISRQTVIYIEHGRNKNINEDTKRKIGAYFFRVESENRTIDNIIDIVAGNDFEEKIDGLKNIFNCTRRKAVEMLLRNVNI